ncbi:hypothetical protein GN244_ATG18897 [Phytophthora infestans]|uniref:Uncharacterized protein n=1 Tax=Phytophthora infestans TaxID=4787 RepID=A0A833S7Y0_PHYIN|nr:hypothetical protein GN244_ATG18897 [Phytophthora infestans]
MFNGNLLLIQSRLQHWWTAPIENYKAEKATEEVKRLQRLPSPLFDEWCVFTNYGIALRTPDTAAEERRKDIITVRISLALVDSTQRTAAFSSRTSARALSY